MIGSSSRAEGEYRRYCLLAGRRWKAGVLEGCIVEDFIFALLRQCLQPWTYTIRKNSAVSESKRCGALNRQRFSLKDGWPTTTLQLVKLQRLMFGAVTLANEIVRVGCVSSFSCFLNPNPSKDKWPGRAFFELEKVSPGHLL